jgi:hypothetical protein
MVSGADFPQKNPSPHQGTAPGPQLGQAPLAGPAEEPEAVIPWVSWKADGWDLTHELWAEPLAN